MTAAIAHDHGGGLDRAVKRYGGTRADWVDLSTGINPQPYPLPDFRAGDWTDLPDNTMQDALIVAARSFWNIPEKADILAAPGASALIARLPLLDPPGHVQIALRTYNEHAAAFTQAGWAVNDKAAPVRVIVHPNNPDGRLWDGTNASDGAAKCLVIDESFCDVSPARSHIAKTTNPDVVVLKSFGKFWGLAGLRLGFAIGSADRIGRLRNMLGPWPVSGPALRVGALALNDVQWADTTRRRLAKDAARLDRLISSATITSLGGTTLFRLFDTPNATAVQAHFARHHIWTRIFPYSDKWVRMGLPGTTAQWAQLETAVSALS